MAHRLETVDASLFAALSGIDQSASRRVRLNVAKWVAQRMSLTDERIQTGLSALAEDGPISVATQSGVSELAAELDETAWDKQDLIESGMATEAEYESVFRLARAATAVLFALDDANTDAAAETCYEAQAAVDDVSEVRTVALSYLAG